MLQTSSKEVVNEQVDDTQALDYKGLCGGKNKDFGVRKTQVIITTLHSKRMSIYRDKK